jgi:deoxyribodipyrimidine photolyase-related protein
MEYFYREMRKHHGVLMDGPAGDQPEGGQWNFDADNRQAFGRRRPRRRAAARGVQPDATTREVMALVEARFASTPAGWTTSPGR